MSNGNQIGIVGYVARFLLICSVFASCSGGSPTESKPPEPTPTLIATWDLVSMRLNGIEVNPDGYYYSPVQLIVRADGTGQELDTNGRIYPLTWTTDNRTLVINQVQSDGSISTSDWTYTLSSTNLTITIPAQEFVYVKA